MGWPQGSRFRRYQEARAESLSTIGAFRGILRISSRFALVNQRVLLVRIISSRLGCLRDEDTLVASMREQAAVALLALSSVLIPPASRVVNERTFIVAFRALPLEVELADLGGPHAALTR